MDFRFEIGDMVLVANTRSPYWNHSGMIKDSEYDSEQDSNIYYVDIGSDDIKKFVEQDLRLDEMDSEPTEIVK